MRFRFIMVLLMSSLICGFTVSGIRVEAAVMLAADTESSSVSDGGTEESVDTSPDPCTEENVQFSSEKKADPQIVTDITAGISAEDAFSGYVDELFGSAEELYISPSYSIARRENLTDEDLMVYDALAQLVKNVSDGESASSVAAVNLSAYGGKEDFSLQTVLYALLADYPYEMYWFDKTAGAYSTDPDSGGVVQIGLYVSKDYSSSGTRGTIDVDAAKTAAPKKAATLAQTVGASQYQEDLYTALDYYRQWICDNTDYDYSAAGTGNTSYGDPWQMISVFDDDSTTKAVCEGYAKAFQYLSDLYIEHAGLAKYVNCYTVSGTLTSGSINGSHMWNIVRMEDGKNYIVDVTNCDIGTDSRSLFLVGASDISTMEHPAESGNIRTVSYRGYSTDGSDVRYSYEHTGRSGTTYPSLDLYSEDEIAPSADNYDPASAQPCFYDVMDADAYYYDAVYSLARAGIVSGTSDTTFSPTVPVTRAQFVTFLYRETGSPETEISNTFTDISGVSTEFQKAISWAAANGITDGVTSATFAPKAEVTREQAVTFLFRYFDGRTADKTASNTTAFKDVDPDAYYADAVSWGAENGIVNGYDADTFGAGRDTTRGEAVTFIYRAMAD